MKISQATRDEMMFHFMRIVLLLLYGILIQENSADYLANEIENFAKRYKNL